MSINLKQLPNIWLKQLDLLHPDKIKVKYEPLIREVFDKKLKNGEDISLQLNRKNCAYIFRMVTESFIREYWDYIYNWNDFWYAFKASKDFIRECPVKSWYYISKYQKLSERFIEEYEDRIDWDVISEHQTLSREFCLKHKKDVNWASIKATQEWYD